MARQRKLLDEVKRGQVLALLSVGCSRKFAAGFVGCSRWTLWGMAKQDRQFAADLKRAEAQAEVLHLQQIAAAGKKDWRASAWWLERKLPERYALRKPRVMTVEQVQRALAELAKVVCEMVPGADQRNVIVARVKEVAKELRADEEEDGTE